VGQQQLLLLVLAVIIVGVSIVVGIGIFQKHAEKSNIDMVVNELIEMGSLAHQYYYKPSMMGGGDQKFTGLTLNDITGGKDSPIGTQFQLTVVDSAKVTLSGTCAVAKKGDGSSVQVVATVTPDDIQTQVNY
jgi:Tfp pilus assembly protein PilE